MSLHDTPTSELSLVNEHATDFDSIEELAGFETTRKNGDLVFTAEQLDKLDHTTLRRLAAAVESDEVNGKSNALQLREFFRGQRSLTEYAED